MSSIHWTSERKSSKEFVMKNLNYILKAGKRNLIHFYFDYALMQPPPKMIQLQLNGKDICRLNTKPKPISTRVLNGCYEDIIILDNRISSAPFINRRRRIKRIDCRTKMNPRNKANTCPVVCYL